jgi:hypothetical protein
MKKARALASVLTQRTDKSHMRRTQPRPWPDCHQLDDRLLVEELSLSKWSSPLLLRGRYLQMLTSEFKTRQLAQEPDAELLTFWNWFLDKRYHLRIEGLVLQSRKPISIWPLLSLAYQRFKKSCGSEQRNHGWPWDQGPEISGKVQQATDEIWKEFFSARNSEPRGERLIFDFFLDGLLPQEIAFLCQVPPAEVTRVLEHAKNQIRESLHRKWA